MPKVKLSIVIPNYREKDLIDATYKKLKVVKSLGIPYEIIIVNDGGENIVLPPELLSDSIEIFNLDKNLGKGFAIFYGVDKAKGEYILYIDADNDIDPDIIEKLYYTIESEDVDMVYANKYHPLSEVKRGFIRNFGSRIINLLIHTIIDIDIKDTQTGAKIYKGEALKHIKDIRLGVANGFAFEVENAILLKKIKGRTKDIPVKITPSSQSSISFFTIIEFLKEVFKLKKYYYKSIKE